MQILIKNETIFQSLCVTLMQLVGFEVCRTFSNIYVLYHVSVVVYFSTFGIPIETEALG